MRSLSVLTSLAATAFAFHTTASGSLIVKYDFETMVNTNTVKNNATSGINDGVLQSPAVVSTNAKNGIYGLTTRTNGSLRVGLLDIGDQSTTIAMWVQFAAGGVGARTLYANTQVDYTNGLFWFVDLGTGTLKVRTGVNNNKDEADSAAGVLPNDGAYHHLICILNRTSGSALFYVDGQAVTMTDTTIRTDYKYTASNGTYDDSYIGRPTYDNKNYADANFDDVQIYRNEILTADQISNLVNPVPEPACAGLLALGGLRRIGRRK